MFSIVRLWRFGVVAALLALLVVAGPAGASKPLQQPRDLYLWSYNGDCASLMSVFKGVHKVKSWEPVGGPCVVASAMAVTNRIRTLGARPGEVGAEYTLGRIPTGVTYPYPDSIVMDLPDGTTDGRHNYVGGYFDGTVYRFSRNWADPEPLFDTGLYLGGVAYDSRSRTMWVLDSRADFEGGLGVIRNYTLDGTLLSEFVVVGGATPQPFGLAYDAKTRSLWISRNVGLDQPITLEKYSTHGDYLGTVTTEIVGIPNGMEFRFRRR
jgi:hypothetical protein